MIQIEGIGILIPLVVGALAAVGTMLIHALPLRATIDFVRYEKNSDERAEVFGAMSELLRWWSRTRFWLTWLKWPCGRSCS